MDCRQEWVRKAALVTGPVFHNLARGALKQNMPVQSGFADPDPDRSPFTHLEALGRSLAGIAPWLAAEGISAPEEKYRSAMLEEVLAALEQCVAPASPDQIDFGAGPQVLVDAAFLAQGLLRGWDRLWHPLSPATRARILDALRATRIYRPGFNNWLLFSAMVEAFLCRAGGQWDRMRVDYAIRQTEQFYAGDGAYNDGPFFHWDYYNSFVILPMLVEILDVVCVEDAVWDPLREIVRARFRRFAVVQERMIGPDGTYPLLGRSLAYRAGAFQTLAMAAWRRELPQELAPARVRAALAAVLHRTLDAPGTFDARGWLRIGVAGDQPSVGERYISTGSLYLCSAAFLPLGLPPDNAFWADPAQDWTARRAWSGADFHASHALKDEKSPMMGWR